MSNSKFVRNDNREVENYINDLVDELDREWLDNCHEGDGYYFCDVDAGELLKNFKDNYSAKTHGLVFGDNLTAEEIIFAIGGAAVVKLIKETSSVESCDYYIQHNEMASVQIGEVDYEILREDHPDAFTPEDGDSKEIYGNPCERLILKLDPAEFLEGFAAVMKVKVKALKKAKKAGALVSELKKFKAKKRVVKKGEPESLNRGQIIEFRKKS